MSKNVELDQPRARTKAPEDGHAAKIRWKTRLARTALLIEALWPRFWAVIAVVGVFVLLSALEVWQLLPPRVHLVALIGFAIAFLATVTRLLLVRRPSAAEVFDRVEKASALPHRPLTAVRDRLPEEASPEARALWQAHQERMAAALEGLKAGKPHPRIDKADPLALRIALVLVLGVVAVASFNDLRPKLLAAFDVKDASSGPGFRIDTWVNPPAYTQKEPIVLASVGRDETVAVPEGSTVSVKVNGSGAASTTVTLSGAKANHSLERQGEATDGYAEFSGAISEDSVLSVSSGLLSNRSWKLKIVPDRAPTIAFSGPIEATDRAALLFKYKVEDDYGVASAEAKIERQSTGEDDKAGQTPLQIGQPPSFGLALPRSPIKAAEAKTYKDLSSHPWAGLPVIVTLSARDEAGNVGYSRPRGFILPERKFTKPLAKAVVDQRRALVENPWAPAGVRQNLDAIAEEARQQNTDASVYLSLRSAYWRLSKARTLDDVESVVEQLWDVALKIEEGNVSEAEKQLRAAEDKLREALARGASREELDRLMAELRQAMDNFLRALAAQDKGKDNQLAQGSAQSISPKDLSSLVDQIESLAKMGSAEAAQKLLSELRDVLENLKTAKAGKEGEDSAEEGERLRQIDQLTNLSRQQQQLLDQTFKAQQDEAGAANDNGNPSAGGQQRGQSRRLQQKQQALKDELNDVLGADSGKGDGSLRQKLNEAGKAMGEAEKALGAGDLPGATQEQTDALNQLRQATRQLAEQMMQAAGQNPGGAGGGRDPLNRGRRDYGSETVDIDLPKEGTVQRARQILDELRKRLGQQTRPPAELEYLERLIKSY